MSLDEFLKRPTPEITLPEKIDGWMDNPDLLSRFLSIGLTPERKDASNLNFSGSAFSRMRDGDKRRMAATAEEGTAPKPVQVNAEANVRRSNSGNIKSGVTAGETASTFSSGPAPAGLRPVRDTSEGVLPQGGTGPTCCGLENRHKENAPARLFKAPRKPRRCRYCGNFDFETALIFRRSFTGLNYVCRDSLACLRRRLKKRPGPHFV